MNKCISLHSCVNKCVIRICTTTVSRLGLVDEVRTVIYSCVSSIFFHWVTLLSVLSLSGQFIPGGIQQVCSLLKPQITPKEFHIAPKPFFKLFVWQQLPSIFLQADYSDNSCVFVFLSFLFLFSRWQESHFATSSTRTLCLYSSVCR